MRQKSLARAFLRELLKEPSFFAFWTALGGLNLLAVFRPWLSRIVCLLLLLLCAWAIADAVRDCVRGAVRSRREEEDRLASDVMKS